MRTILRIFIGTVVVSLLLVGVAAVARVAPGAPFVAIPFGILILLVGVRMFGRIAAARDIEEAPLEDVAALDVYFVCGECGTEYRVEKIGEIQIPRHCGERMLVQRRPRPAPELN